jgi:uncharacterized membrane protein
MPPARPAAALSPRIVPYGFAAATFVWLLLLLVAPYLVSHRTPGTPLFDLGGIVYLAGRIVCHQRADRSFHAWGVQLPVCGRCVGLYAAAVLGSVLAAVRRRIPAHQPDWLLRFAIAGTPTAGSIALELLGVWPQSPAIRCIAALPLGFAVAWFVGVHAADLPSRAALGVRDSRLR